MLSLDLFSVAHMDYCGPPRDFRPPKMAPRHDVYVDYLQTDDALPYPAPLKNRSEAAVSIEYIPSL